MLSRSLVFTNAVQQLLHQGPPAPPGAVLGGSDNGAAARAPLSAAGHDLVDTAERMPEAISREIAGLDQQLAVWVEPLSQP